MKIPLSWLKEYLQTELSPQQIAENLTLVGLEVEEITPVEQDDIVFDIALTPNLVHCASVRGIARELAAITQEKLQTPKYTLTESEEKSIQNLTSVTVENPELCPRYACRLIEGVTVKPSPPWLQQRLERCGFRSVNNIVDITNLVLMEFGHPLHAFDFDTLEEKRIVVRNAKKGEKIQTLDSKEHYPSEETLLICDGRGPIAIAGIMGSLHTEVGERTTTVLLEAAYFEPKQVRRSSKRMGIHTEASYRFERGANPLGVIEALDRAAAWISELSGGQILPGVIDTKQGEFPPSIISCRLSRVNQILGTQLALTEAETILRRLGFEIHSVKQETIEVVVPPYRHDIHAEIDLIEEIARLYGFDNIHKREKAFYRRGTLPHSPVYLFEREVRHRLIAEGLQEFSTCNLISPSEAALVAPDCMPSRSLISLLNPTSVDQSVLRTSLLPGMLKVVKYNTDHDCHMIAGFEVGRVHFQTKDQYFEPSVASLILSSKQSQDHWEKKPDDFTFFDLKGIVENLLKGLKIKHPLFHPTKYENFHPQRQAALSIEGVEIGILGEIHPKTLKKIDLSHPIFFAEFNLEDLKRFVPSEIKMEELPQYPASSRDWTLTLKEEVTAGSIIGLIPKSTLLESVSLIDIYHSEKLGLDSKNVTFRFVYRDREKTLSVEEVEGVHQKITQNVFKKLKEEGKVK